MSLIFLSFLYALSLSTTAAMPTDFINASCHATLYSTLCYKSLKPYAWKIQKSPRLIAMMALSISVKTARETESYLAKLAKSDRLSSRESGAVKDCLKEMGNTVSQLNDSVTELKKLDKGDFSWHMSNLKTWVSAALTDESTCTDGFSDGAQNGEIKSKIQAKMGIVVQLTSNALALCNKLG
ncbi:Plant invertase/pectin methylesterase inhibitor superfamily protein [Striga hermonthica]|uniref:Plant invertase/pectin methylesterase inhibitor superfamily protein n=1 Tax=Striga hermonthica TaxID=68872 RepID=A0A9N7NRW7_STRHE|nr:Plant invertase/pectin methylesterase inhibitor superfamily protein [Striga hermonthica]